MSRDTAPIEAAVGSWATAWSARDADAILEHWDQTDTDTTYLPAERGASLIGFSEVSAYVKTVCSTFVEVRHRVETPVYRRLSDNTGLAFYVLAWMFADGRGPIGGSCRVTSVWKRRSAAWRAVHYAEAPLAPLLELQAFYEAVAADGLDAIPKRTGTS